MFLTCCLYHLFYGPCKTIEEYNIALKALEDSFRTLWFTCQMKILVVPMIVRWMTLFSENKPIPIGINDLKNKSLNHILEVYLSCSSGSKKKGRAVLSLFVLLIPGVTGPISYTFFYWHELNNVLSPLMDVKGNVCIILPIQNFPC